MWGELVEKGKEKVYDKNERIKALYQRVRLRLRKGKWGKQWFEVGKDQHEWKDVNKEPKHDYERILRGQ